MMTASVANTDGYTGHQGILRKMAQVFPTAARHG